MSFIGGSIKNNYFYRYFCCDLKVINNTSTNYINQMQGSENQQLKRRFERRQTFYKEMESVQAKYKELQQYVFYSPIEDINSKMIVSLPNKEQGRKNIFIREDFYIFNGQFQPSGSRSFEKLMLQIVQTIPRPKRPFGIIYINTLALSEAEKDFKKVMELLPKQYLFNLTKLYLLQASFLSRNFSWFSFGTITNYIKNKTVYVDYLKDLQKQTHIDPLVLKEILPKNVLEELARLQPEKEVIHHTENIKSMLTSSVSPARPQEVYKPQGFTSQIIQPTYSSNKIVKKRLNEYELGPSGAPIVLELLVCFLSQKQSYLKCQGLFRKSVSIDEETQMLEQLDHKNYAFIDTVKDPHLVANVIKRFFAYLQEPIVPYSIFEKFMAEEGQPGFKQLVVNHLKDLPKVNRMTLFLLFNFLIEKVLPHAVQSKMGENNLCIVFGPCLMRSQTHSFRDLIDAKKIIVVTGIILHNFEAVFGNIEKRNQLRRNSYIQYRREEIIQRKQQPKEPQIIQRTSDYIKRALQEEKQIEEEKKIELQGIMEIIPLSTQQKKSIIQLIIPSKEYSVSCHGSVKSKAVQHPPGDPYTDI